jgi:hypothetical protein
MEVVQLADAAEFLDRDTPPEQRGRGYSSALSAHVSAEQLDAGR